MSIAHLFQYIFETTQRIRYLYNPKDLWWNVWLTKFSFILFFHSIWYRAIGLEGFASPSPIFSSFSIFLPPHQLNYWGKLMNATYTLLNLYSLCFSPSHLFILLYHNANFLYWTIIQITSLKFTSDNTQLIKQINDSMSIILADTDC